MRFIATLLGIISILCFTLVVCGLKDDIQDLKHRVTFLEKMNEKNLDNWNALLEK